MTSCVPWYWNNSREMRALPFISLIAAMSFSFGCVKSAPKENAQPAEEPAGEDPSGDKPSGDTSGWTEPDLVVYQEPFLVTSPIIMQFIENVTYDERDYSYTHVTDAEYAPYGAPGDADLPPVVSVKWDLQGYDGTLTLKLKDNEWDCAIALSSGTTTYDISNLVPGKTYNYAVTRDDTGQIAAHGVFETTGLVHQVFFHSKVRNARDLGGWSTIDGKKLKYRKLYRGGDIGSSYLNKKGITEMLDQGIKAELDLRESKDVNSSKSRLGDDIAFFNADMSKAYGGLIREYPEKVAASFKFIVKCLREDKPVYFHCSIGRDRTGTMAALMLGVLGVSESDISKEYELLFFSPKDWSLNGGKTEFDYSRVKQYGLRYCCDTIWQLGGKALGVSDSDTSVSFKKRAEAYLTSNGVPQKDIDDFRRLMLE